MGNRRRGTSASRGIAAFADSPRAHNDHAEFVDQLTQYRHLGAHRLGQDDPERADSLLRRPHPPGPGGPRGGGHDGPHGPGEGARDHDHQRRHDRPMERSANQPHRHAGPRRLYRRSGTKPPGPRRRSARALRSRRSPGPVDHDRSPDAPIPCPPRGLHQQDGPHRSQSRCRGPPVAGQARLRRDVDAAADRVGGAFCGSCRPGDPQGALFRRPTGRAGADRRRPSVHGGGGSPRAAGTARSAGDVQRRVDGTPAGRGGSARGDDPRGGPLRRSRRAVYAGVPRNRLPQQGRSGAARRGGPVSPLAAGLREPGPCSRPDRDENSPRALARRADRGDGVQGCRRPVRRLDVYADLPGKTCQG